MLLKIFLSLLLVLISFNGVCSADFIYNSKDTVIGVVKEYTVQENDSLIEIARHFGLGYNEIVDANPEVDPFLPGKGNVITIPTMWILPDASSDGIVINLSEMRLYYFIKKKDHTAIKTFPIGIGDDGTETPLGIFKVTDKKKNPSWYVPDSIKKERPELPDIVPPGPNNPLGSRALRLSNSSYLIHGTNRPWAVGRKVTHGCIRLYPEDILKLYDIIPLNTKVQIIRQPVKVGIRDGKVYIEVHKDNEISIDYLNTAVELLRKKGLLKGVDLERLYKAIEEKRGIPVMIS